MGARSGAAGASQSSQSSQFSKPVSESVCLLRLLRSGVLRMRAIRAAVLSVRLSIDYSSITKNLVVAANVVGGATAVLLAGFVAVATGLN